MSKKDSQKSPVQIELAIEEQNCTYTYKDVSVLQKELKSMKANISSLRQDAKLNKRYFSTLSTTLKIAVVLIPIITTVSNQVSRELLQKDNTILVPVNITQDNAEE